MKYIKRIKNLKSKLSNYDLLSTLQTQFLCNTDTFINLQTVYDFFLTLLQQYSCSRRPVAHETCNSYCLTFDRES